jgi:release factor glutamine methyltransferase
MPDPTGGLHTLLTECTEQLRHASVPDPRRETLRLWSEITGASVAQALVGAETASETQAAELRQAVRRRAQGEPCPYVTGVVGFRHLSLRIDRRALIPRPETEGLVDLLLQRARSGVVADIGTGSGCIALSLAQEGGFSRVVGIDCSPDCIALARENSRSVTTAARMDFVRGDLTTSLRSGSCDALVSNPPYLTREEYAQLDPSVREWEPALALTSGADGMEATARLILEGRTVLAAGGWLALEVDCGRAAAAARLAGEHGWQDVSIHKDLFGRERYLLARRSVNGDLGQGTGSGPPDRPVR